jgi:drug/metabolite transporter (DMT)-like permease
MILPAVGEPTEREQLTGMICVAAGIAMASLQDAFIKLISGGYSVHEIVFVRSMVALPIVLAVAAVENGGIPRPRMLRMHAIRGVLMYMCNNLYYLAIARISMAVTVTLYSVTPLIVISFGALLLRERVGRRTWIAIAISGSGVLLILRPGAAGLDPVMMFPLLAAVAYALTTVLTRRLGQVEKAGTLALSLTVVYALSSGATGLVIAAVGPSAQEDSAFRFLLTPWRAPSGADLALMAACGLITALAFILISQGYRLAEAHRAAPFEYSAMPSGVFWGYVFFRYVPSLETVAGAVVIVLGGLCALWPQGRRRQR